MDGRRRQEERKRGEYRNANRDNLGRMTVDLGQRSLLLVPRVPPLYPRVTFLLPSLRKPSSTRSFVSSNGNAIDKNGQKINSEPRIAQFPLSAQVFLFSLLAFLQSSLSFSLPPPTIHSCLLLSHVTMQRTCRGKVGKSEEKYSESRVAKFSSSAQRAKGIERGD